MPGKANNKTETPPVDNVEADVSGEEVTSVEESIQALGESLFQDTQPDPITPDPEESAENAEGEEEVLPEVTEEPESETDPLADLLAPIGEEEFPEASWPEGTPDWVPDRIARAKSKAEQAEARAIEAEAKLQELTEQAEQAPKVTGPVEDLETLEDTESKAQSALKLARKWDRLVNRDPEAAAEAIKQVTGQELDDPGAYIDNIIEQAESALESIPAKKAQAREFVQAQKASEQQTEQAFPWFKDKANPLRQKLDAFVAARPELSKVPEYQAILAHAIVGQEVMARRAKSKTPATAPASTKKTPPIVPTGTSSSPSENPADNGISVLRNKAMTGTEDDAKKYLGQLAMGMFNK